MATPLNLANVQGDILVGLSKQTELFYFFEIVQVDAFRSNLTRLIPLITSAANAQNDKSMIRSFKTESRMKATAGDGETVHPGLLPVSGINVAFSAKGIQRIGINDDIGDNLFNAGMEADASVLGDNGSNEGGTFKPDWDAAFLQRKIDGVILVTGENRDKVSQKLEEVKNIFQSYSVSSVEEIVTLVGDVRPGDQRGHEHFGYLDGVSQPAVENVDTPLPGQTPVNQGVVLLGRGNDAAKGRPAWALDGSFLTFRKLPQLVPEFDKFLLDNARPVSDPTANVVDLLGARFVGRWKSGAPLQEFPLQDNPELGGDPQRNNLFEFIPNSQERCPFAAHIRKMNPRKDIDEENGIKPHLILRRGIAFGPEVSQEERQANTTQNERGLYFVCYQSDLSNGFHFLMQAWANNVNFPPRTTPEQPGFDPIIGQQNGGGEREMTGAFGENTADSLKLSAQWVNSKGGEYFFSPSLQALKETFAKA